jgi:hypothetical protein
LIIRYFTKKFAFYQEVESQADRLPAPGKEEENAREILEQEARRR